jgi:hypothetical protein
MFKGALTSFAVALALAALVVPAAVAGTDSGLGIPAGREDYSGSVVGQSVPGLFQVTQSSAPIVSEMATGLVQPPASSQHVAAVSNDSGFDWSDAGIGAGVVFGTMLLGASGLLALRRQGGTLAH